jgi:hypothetical protein
MLQPSRRGCAHLVGHVNSCLMDSTVTLAGGVGLMDKTAPLACCRPVASTTFFSVEPQDRRPPI